MRILSTALLCVLASGLVGGEAPQAPQLLSQTGLYAAGGRVDPRHLPYAPQYPLWSDGAAKTRWIGLPAGTAIDGSNEDGWVFPVGTKIWKEFAFGGWKVETRLMWRATASEWVFASYQWNAGQTEATLVPVKGQPNVADLGSGKAHSIPSISDCRACHENAGIEVLGFSALQLSPDRDPGAFLGEPLAPGMADLKVLLDRGLLKGARKDLLTKPPRIPGDAKVRPVLGYLATNCGSCHRGDSPLPELNLDLRQTSQVTRLELEPAHRTALGQRGLFVIPGDGAEGSYLLAPGNSARSSVIHRMLSRNPDVQMPPLGTVLPDEVALKGLRAWIDGMPADKPAAKP